MSLSSSAPWLKYYGNVPHHLSYPQKTIYQMVKAAAERNPKLPAYEFMGKKSDLHAVYAEDRRDGTGLSRHGHQKGRPRHHLYAQLPRRPCTRSMA